jgi:hypothetical protein
MIRDAFAKVDSSKDAAIERAKNCTVDFITAGILNMSGSDIDAILPRVSIMEDVSLGCDKEFLTALAAKILGTNVETFHDMPAELYIRVMARTKLAFSNLVWGRDPDQTRD